MRRLVLLLVVSIAVSAGAAEKAKLAVVEKVSSSVGFYTAEGKRLGGVEVGAYPHEIVLSPDGRYAYVSDNGVLWMTDAGIGGNTISVIDLAAMKRSGVISLGDYRRPHGMDVDPRTGRLVVTIENPDGLLLVDPVERKVLRRYDVKGKAPHMVALSRDGAWAFVSNASTGDVAAVHLETGNVTLIPSGARPQGGTLSRDGALYYVTNADGKSIAIIDTAKRVRIGTIAAGPGVARIALTPDGKTLVYNLGEGGDAVAFADVALRKQTTVIRLGGRPLSLTLSRDGQLAYLGIQDQDRIVVVSVPERRIVREIRTPKGAGPDPVLPLP
jgi:DNA-binding beta-propeller fold protein YncE